MFEILVESSIRTAVAAAGVGLLLALFRVRDPALRHSAWKLVLGAAIAMPLLVGGVPEVELAVLPGVDVPDAVQTTVDEFPTIATTTEPAPAFRWTTAYFTIAFIFLARIAIGYGMGIRWVRAAGEFDHRAIPESVPGVRYRSSSRFSVPMTFGSIFPVVLLPEEFRNWNERKQRAVLAHEHAHVRRRDFLTNLIASVTRAVHWMNPLAWWLERHLAHLAEQAADDVAAGRDRRSYAEILIEIAESAGPNRIRAVAMARRSGLGKRIANLSNGRKQTMRSSTRTWTLSLGILALVGAASCMTPTRAASSSSLLAASAQEEAEAAARERREAREQELRILEAELERAQERREVDRATATRQAEVQRELERQRALEERELQREFERADEQRVREREAFLVETRERIQALLDRQNAAEALRRDRNVEVQSLEDQIREAERRVTLVREELRANEERLRMLVEQLEAQEVN